MAAAGKAFIWLPGKKKTFSLNALIPLHHWSKKKTKKNPNCILSCFLSLFMLFCLLPALKSQLIFCYKFPQLKDAVRHLVWCAPTDAVLLWLVLPFEITFSFSPWGDNYKGDLINNTQAMLSPCRNNNQEYLCLFRGGGSKTFCQLRFSSTVLWCRCLQKSRLITVHRCCRREIFSTFMSKSWAPRNHFQAPLHMGDSMSTSSFGSSRWIHFSSHHLSVSPPAPLRSTFRLYLLQLGKQPDKCWRLLVTQACTPSAHHCNQPSLSFWPHQFQLFKGNLGNLTHFSPLTAIPSWIQYIVAVVSARMN